MSREAPGIGEVPRNAVQMRRGQLIFLSAQGMRVQELDAELARVQDSLPTL